MHLKPYKYMRLFFLSITFFLLAQEPETNQVSKVGKLTMNEEFCRCQILKKLSDVVMVREIKKINMSNELIYKFLYTWRWKHKWQMDNHTVVCVFVCVPIITGAVLLRYAISKLRHWDKYPDWLGFSLRGVALRRSLSRYITSLDRKKYFQPSM